jgi:hypothetical protein
MPSQHHDTYSSLSQRVADAFARSLSRLEAANALPEGAAALHAFFAEWYREMATSPEGFGLPVTEDLCIDDAENRDKGRKAEISRRVKKIRESIGYGLELLLLAGTAGRLRDDAMVLSAADWTAYLASGSRPRRAMLRGLARVGLAVTETSEYTMLRNDAHPGMMPTLRSLVQGCSQVSDASVALFHLARCDFRAQTRDYQPGVADLYRVFSPDEYERLMTLHRYFLANGYGFALYLHDIHGWEVKYQGDRKVKSTPFFHVEYSVRRRNPLCPRLKCAAAHRIIPLVEGRPQPLQDAFFRRVYHCRGDACGWCRNQKTLRPSPLQYRGEQHIVCWYLNPDLAPLDDAAVDLVKEFAEMHAELAARG